MPKSTLKARTLKFAFGGLIFVLLAISVSFQSHYEHPPLPNPNGYDDFVKAGWQVSGNVSDIDKKSPTELTQLIGRNQEALRLARIGLNKSSRIPVMYSADYAAWSTRELMNTKELARIFNAQGRLAEWEKRTNDAVRIYLEGIRASQAACRGGILIDKLVGTAAESINEFRLRTLVPQLSAPICRETVKALETIDALSDPLEMTLEEERKWSNGATSLKEKFNHLLHYRDDQQVMEVCIGTLQYRQQARRQLIIDLATRAYELEHNRRPDTVKVLVPKYLNAVPGNPETGKSMNLTNFTKYPSDPAEQILFHWISH